MTLRLVNNAIMMDKLGTLRQAETEPDTFRRIIGELSVQLFFAAASELPFSEREICTPISTATVRKVSKEISLISVMRAGNGMLEAILHVWPKSSVGHIGIYRDKFLNNTVEYYCKTPGHLSDTAVFVMDPIIATGDTAIASVSRLKDMGCRDISFLSIVTSALGKDLFREAHPDVNLYAVSCDDELVEDGYIKPGLGDVGARFYNSK
ncbi:uracil phosphoribosyltransferase [Microbulbifer bruguierae]|uniref:Uracil phosphoribosyltransferase n=1 Tax=Microbulbifer bruguierae TaxID=3029061 RepID=A0ABY8NE39_9GAMM|nr:uracil phosphoribosyltransferase [Microbulbifer bruguierae]WGL17189.1 uracil phosphoribosyltransferase [Microbulbifer bruguierae]